MERKKVKLVKVLVNGELVDAKECTQCSLVKTLNEYTFKKNGLGKKTSQCKDCRKKYFDSRKELKSEYDKKYREKNIDKLLEKSRKWHEENREKANADRKERYYANHEHELAYRREYHNEHKEELKEYQKEYYKNNKGKIIDYRERNKERIIRNSRKRYRENKLEYAERWKKYYEENKEWLLEKHKNNYHENKEQYSERWRRYYFSDRGQEVTSQIAHRRREREKTSLASLSTKQWKECKNHFNHKCAYCLSDEKLTKDHFVPVSKGGELTVKNIVPVCNRCNCSKKDKDFFIWYPKQDFYSERQINKIMKYLDIQENQQQIAFF